MMSKRGWPSVLLGIVCLLSFSLPAHLFAASPSQAQSTPIGSAPPEWVNFYGVHSTLDGEPIPAGAEIVAYAGDKRCGSFIVHTAGQYGVMPCYADRPEQPGAQPGDSIRFTVDGFEAIPRGPDEPVWTFHGDLKQVELEAHGTPGTLTPTATWTVMPPSTSTPTPTWWSPSPTFTPTGTPSVPPSPTATATGWVFPTATPTPIVPPAPWPPGTACWDIIQDGGFEAGGYWQVDATLRPATRSTAQAHSGTYAMRLGITEESNASSPSAIRQRLQVPANATSAMLSFYYYPTTEAEPRGDYWEVLLFSPGTNQTVATPWRNPLSNDRRWLLMNIDLSAFKGYTFDLYVNVYNDGLGGRSALYLDDVVFQVCTGAPPSPTPTHTAFPPLPTPATPYPTPAGQCQELVTNGGFEAGQQGWYLGPTQRMARLVSDIRHSGNYAMQLGFTDGENVMTFSSIRQTVTIPSDVLHAEITFWVYPMSTAAGGQDHQEFVILSPADNSTRALPWRVWSDNSRTWIQQRVDLSGFKGESIVLYFNAYNDGAGGITALIVDDISLLACRQAVPPTPTATLTAIALAETTPTAGPAGESQAVLTQQATMARATPTPIAETGIPTPAITAIVAILIAILVSALIFLVVRRLRAGGPPPEEGGSAGFFPPTPPESPSGPGKPPVRVESRSATVPFTTAEVEPPLGRADSHDRQGGEPGTTAAGPRQAPTEPSPQVRSRIVSSVPPAPTPPAPRAPSMPAPEEPEDIEEEDNIPPMEPPPAEDSSDQDMPAEEWLDSADEGEEDEEDREDLPPWA